MPHASLDQLDVFPRIPKGESCNDEDGDADREQRTDANEK
jgi:hypothetical protein